MFVLWIPPGQTVLLNLKIIKTRNLPKTTRVKSQPSLENIAPEARFHSLGTKKATESQQARVKCRGMTVTPLCPWKNTTSDSGNNLPNSLSILCTRSCFHWRGQERLLCHLLFHPRIGLSPVFNSSPQENINIVEHSNFTGSGGYLRILLRCKIGTANWDRPWNIAFW